MRNKLLLNLNVYTLYRKELMGIATIMIIICHIVGNDVLLPPIVSKVLTLGNYGVDIFLFLSGLGLYYSLQNNHTSISSWYKRRYIRIFVPYLIATLPCCIIRMYLGDFSVLDTILSLTTLDFWIFARGAWFVSAIVPIYFFTPYLSRFIESRKNKLIWVVVIISVLLMLSEINIINHPIYENIQFVMRRTPMFVLGLYMAVYIKEGREINIFNAVMITICSIISYLFLGIYTALSLPILIALGYFVNYIHNRAIIDNALKFMGIISLESYLMNIDLPEIFRYIHFGEYGYGNYLPYLLVVVTGIPLAYYINRISSKVIKII